MAIRNDLNQCKTVDDLLTFISKPHLQPQIGRLGGRRFVVPNEKGSLSLNEIVSCLSQIKQPSSLETLITTSQIFNRISELDKEASELLHSKSFLTRLFN